MFGDTDVSALLNSLQRTRTHTYTHTHTHTHTQVRTDV